MKLENICNDPKHLQELIARICHELTRFVPRPDGSVPQEWNSLSETAKEMSISAVMNILSREKMPLAEELHDIWMQPLIDDGWTYGETYSLEEKKTPNIVPFNQLPKTEQYKDMVWYMMLLTLSNNFRNLEKLLLETNNEI